MADETLILYPVVGWDVATLPQGNAMVLIRYVPGIPPLQMTNEQLQAAAQSLRLGMTAEQCDELAAVLQTTAEKSRARLGVSN